jgi:hypothetical protein
MNEECIKWRCSNKRVDGYAYCEDHPPLVDHGLNADTVECPHCGEVGAGTIHDDFWYCSDSHGRDGCGEFFDPYAVAGVGKKPQWPPGDYGDGE